MKFFVKNHVISFLAVFVLILGVSSPSHASVDGAKNFVQKLGNEAITIMADEDMTQEKINGEFRKFLDRYFDLNAISQFVVSKQWRQASPEEKTEFKRLFREMIVNIYSGRFSNYQNEKFTVTGGLKRNERDSIVSSEITFGDPNRPSLRLDWRVRKVGEGYRVIDLLVENVSMSITQRQEFASIMQNNGIEPLLVTMRERYQR
jgi:phospholipid transport system substrate-binding protein